MNMTQPPHKGTAYEMKPSTYIASLTEVGRGTPMGELLRRYWHPVGLSTHATNIPREVRALGEDLVLFRDGKGRPGLVHSRCCHRGTTLYYGKVEEDGIRCCYHGWKFDVEGHCLEQPCEPEMGTHYRIYTAARVSERGAFLPKRAGAAASNRKRWKDMTAEERREFPGDWEAQIGQGPITLHSEERLATNDKGIVLLRRLLQKQVDEVAAGRDPIGVSFDAAAPPIVFEAASQLSD